MANTAKIPVVDISDERNQQEVARELVDAAIKHGFVYIKNTGKDIPVEAIDEAFEISKRLFKAPLSEKQACSIQQNNRGWSAMHYETLDPATQRVGDYKEAFNFGDFVDGKAQQPIPPTIAPDEARISYFRDLCYNLTLKLNTLLGIGLEVDPFDFFTRAHLRSAGPSGSILRFLYYPPPAPDTPTDNHANIRAGAHSDYGSLTLLFRLRGQPGLEICTGTTTMTNPDGTTIEVQNWAPVPVVPPGTENDPAPPILINIGDLLSYWTGGLLRSTVHRVVFPKGGNGIEGEQDAGPRYSIAYFCHPYGGTKLGVVPSEKVKEYVERKERDQTAKGLAVVNPYAERKVMTADEHLRMRLRASYLQLYEAKA